MDESKEKEILKHFDIMETVETELNKQQNDAVISLITFLCATSVWVLIVALWDKLGRPISPDYMTLGVEIIAFFMFVFILKFTRIDIRKMGITTKGLKKTMHRSVLISVAIVAVMVVVKMLVRPGEPLLWEKFSPLYFLTSVLQEFLARGFLVSCLMGIVHLKGAKHIVVIASSLLFSTLHLYYGFTYMVGAGILSVILGYVYLKDRNIWGVALIHFVFGTLGDILALV